jgi:hypothetical protein
MMKKQPAAAATKPAKSVAHVSKELSKERCVELLSPCLKEAEATLNVPADFL